DRDIRIKSIILLIYDIIASNMSYFLALWLRFDLHFSETPKRYLLPFVRFVPLYTVFLVITFYILRLYRSLWRYASFGELNRIIASTLITTVFHIVGITILYTVMPVSYYLIG